MTTVGLWDPGVAQQQQVSAQPRPHQRRRHDKPCSTRGPAVMRFFLHLLLLGASSTPKSTEGRRAPGVIVVETRNDTENLLRSVEGPPTTRTPGTPTQWHLMKGARRRASVKPMLAEAHVPGGGIEGGGGGGGATTRRRRRSESSASASPAAARRTAEGTGLSSGRTQQLTGLRERPPPPGPQIPEEPPNSIAPVVSLAAVDDDGVAAGKHTQQHRSADKKQNQPSHAHGGDAVGRFLGCPVGEAMAGMFMLSGMCCAVMVLKHQIDEASEEAKADLGAYEDDRKKHEEMMRKRAASEGSYFDEDDTSGGILRGRGAEHAMVKAKNLQARHEDSPVDPSHYTAHSSPTRGDNGFSHLRQMHTQGQIHTQGYQRQPQVGAHPR